LIREFGRLEYILEKVAGGETDRLAYQWQCPELQPIQQKQQKLKSTEKNRNKKK